jgi:biopolymer transport protein ExbD
MRFLVHKRRSAPAVIIVALVDVLIVLLIFLMVTTTFKQQPALKLALPESSQAQKSGVGENQQFEVYISSNGVLQDVQDKTVSLDALKSRLLQEVAKNPQLKIAINADKNAPFYRIVNVMDIVKELKIKSVSASVDTKPAKP